MLCMHKPLHASCYVHTSSLILRCMCTLRSQVEKAVVTVPAYFNDSQRQVRGAVHVPCMKGFGFHLAPLLANALFPKPGQQSCHAADMIRLIYLQSTWLIILRILVHHESLNMCCTLGPLFWFITGDQGRWQDRRP